MFDLQKGIPEPATVPHFSTRNPLRKKFSFYAVFGALFFAIVLVRAYSLGVTYDEAWTINEFVPLSWADIVSFHPCDANNHLLNTLLIKCSFGMMGHSLPAARLPNVLAFICYLIFASRICKKWLPGALGYLGFLLLLLNPFLLDFFGLARGYGLSLGLLLPSLFYFFEWIESRKPASGILAIALAAMAVTANFSLLNYFASVLAVMAGLIVFSKEYRHRSTIFGAAVISFLLFLFLKGPIQALSQSGHLYYGGQTGFYEDTLTTLAAYSGYATQATPFTTLALQYFLSVLLIGLLWSYIFQPKIIAVRTAVVVITFLCAVSVIVQHHLLGTLYLIDRTALFFYPLLMLCFCLCAAATHKTFRYGSVGAFALLLAVNFCLHLNFYKTVTWDFDAHTRQLLEMANETGKREHRKVAVAYSWPLSSAVQYYCKSGAFPFVENRYDYRDRDALAADAEIYFYINSSMPKIGYHAANGSLLQMERDTLLQFPEEHVLAFRLKRPAAIKKR